MHNRLDPIMELQSMILGDIFMLNQFGYKISFVLLLLRSRIIVTEIDIQQYQTL